jgi:acyl-CoA thioester hydrolase
MSESANHQWCQARVRVRYAETDQAGIVYHANYLVWFEIGRVEYCRDHGFNYRDLERESGLVMSVTEAQVRYRRPALYDDELMICTRLSEIRSRSLRFAYELRRAADNELLAEGETAHIIINAEGRARSIPQKYAELLSAKNISGGV